MSQGIVADRRTCNTCGISKPLDDFHRNKSSASGRLPRCKTCRKIADASYVEAHREEARVRVTEWTKANPERARVRVKAWAAANPERIRAIRARFRRSEKGRLAEKRVSPLVRRAARRRYYERNAARWRGYNHDRRARLRGAPGTHTPEDVQAIARAQRMRCAACSGRLGRNPEVDHILPLALGGPNDRLNLQLLCRRCNRSKGALHPVEHARRLGRLL